MSRTFRNHDQVVVHEVLHPGGWCDCGDGPFTHAEWIAHGGKPPVPATPREPDPVPAALIADLLPVVSEIVLAYLTEFWPDKREGRPGLRARAAAIVHRVDVAFATPSPAPPEGLRTALDQAVWGFAGEPRRCSRCNADEGDEHSPTCPMPGLLVTVEPSNG